MLSKFWVSFEALIISIMGTLGTFFIVYHINSHDESTINKSKQNAVIFNIKKRPPPKIIKKIKKHKQKTISKTNVLQVPQLNSELSGVKFNNPINNLVLDRSSQTLDKLLKQNKDNTVMTPDTVDVKPKISFRPNVKYPDKARKRGITGYVVVKMLIDEYGNIQKSKIIDSSPKGIFEEAVLSMIEESKYQPAIYNGEPISIWAKTKIRFELNKL